MKAVFVSLPELYEVLASLANELVAGNATAKQRDLRAQGQKRAREMHQAALFARAIQGSRAIDPERMMIGFPQEEDCDVDAILLWKKDEKVSRLNVQLKELPPSSLAPEIAIHDILRKALRRYHSSHDVVLAIFANRTGAPERIEIPRHNLAGVCAFGFGDERSKMIFLVGYLGEEAVNATVPMELR